MKTAFRLFARKGAAVIAFSLLWLGNVTSGNARSRDTLVIVTFGNSTTAPRKTVDKVYAVRLHELLAKAGIGNRVINAGIPGSHTGSVRDNNLFKIPHGMDRFDTAVLRYHPDWVTINFGINDSWQDKGRKGTSRIPIGEYRHNLSWFIDGILAEGGHVILLTPNPIGEKYKGFHRRRLKKYRRVTKKLAGEKEIYFLNTRKLFKDYSRRNHKGVDVLLLDGVHPNDTGHKLIAEQLAKIITAASEN